MAKGARATWFGGANDPQDNGETASGISTKRRPEILGCAIPMNFGPCKGSPLPRLPWGTKIEVKHPASGKTITVPVIDLGPARGIGNAIDREVPEECAYALRILDPATYCPQRNIVQSGVVGYLPLSPGSIITRLVPPILVPKAWWSAL